MILYFNLFVLAFLLIYLKDVDSYRNWYKGYYKIDRGDQLSDGETSARMFIKSKSWPRRGTDIILYGGKYCKYPIMLKEPRSIFSPPNQIVIIGKEKCEEQNNEDMNECEDEKCDYNKKCEDEDKNVKKVKNNKKNKKKKKKSKKSD